MLNLLRKSLQMELHIFKNILEKLHKGQVVINELTKSAFVQNRKKIAPELFIHLFHSLNQEFYTDNEARVKTWKGFRLLATDGSLITLPHTEELGEIYGFYKNQHETTIVLARASLLYDLKNEMVLDGLLAPHSIGERTLALNHLKYCNSNDLIIYDRGYPSFDLIYEHTQLEINYLIRCKHSFSNAIQRFLASDDKTKLIDLMPGKNKSYKNKSYDKNAKIKVRLVKVSLDSGEVEILITSLLDSNEYPTSIFKQLYFERWGVEKHYDIIKNKIQVENFTGYSNIAIQQDFNCALFISNLQSLIVDELEDEIKSKYGQRKYEYKINDNLSFGFLKNRIVELFMAEEAEKILEELKQLFIKNVEPIRPNRKNKRDVDKYIRRKKPIITKNWKNSI